MTSLDWFVIALYAVSMLAIGGYYSRRTKTPDDYLLGGRNMNSFLVGVSLFATLTSTLSYLALPGEMIQHGPMLFCQIIAYPFAAYVVGWLLIPIIVQLKVTSAYEILESRLGLSVRLVGCIIFLLLRMSWMAAVLYATASTVLVPLLGLSASSTPWICAAMGVITIIYTSAGGMRAVVITDAMQCLIMIIGAIVTVVIISIDLGGVAAWWPTVWVNHWDQPSWGLDATARTSLLGVVISMFTWQICTAGSDQMAIQRFLATRDARAARRSYITSLLTDAVVMLMLAVVGLALIAWFTAHQSMIDASVSLVEEADQLFPRFVLVGLPSGLSGLVIAAILSAAMSSLSSGVNSSCAVISEDFINRLGKTDNAETSVKTIRILSVFIGIVVVMLSILVGAVEGNLIELCFKVVNLLTAPLFVLFFMAIFVRRATTLGALAGLAASIGAAVGIAYFNLFGLSFLWMMPISLLTGIIIGTACSSSFLQILIRLYYTD